MTINSLRSVHWTTCGLANRLFFDRSHAMPYTYWHFYHFVEFSCKVAINFVCANPMKKPFRFVRTWDKTNTNLYSTRTHAGTHSRFQSRCECLRPRTYVSVRRHAASRFGRSIYFSLFFSLRQMLPAGLMRMCGSLDVSSRRTCHTHTHTQTRNSNDRNLMNLFCVFFFFIILSLLYVYL